MSLRHFLLIAALLPSTVALHAEDAASPKETAVPPYELKNRSAFMNVDDTARAPFWPIGWIKRKSAQAAQAQAPVVAPIKVDEKNFKVTSILIGTGATPSLAVINGRAYTEGELLRMPKGTTPPMRIRVQRINDGSVILQNAEQTLVASLHRPELSTHRPEELLLDPDR